MEQKLTRQDIYDFSYQGQEYFYEPGSGGIYKYHPVLRAIFSLPASFTLEQVIRELSPRYPAEKVKAFLTQLSHPKPTSLENNKESDPVVKNRFELEEMYLQVSHRCNLGCTYCYAQGGNFGGAGQMMTETTARQAIDFFLCESGEHKKCIVNYDGGEPFLNFPLVRSITAYSQKMAKQMGKHIVFSISTNGTLFTRQNVEYLAANRFGIGISIDGDQSIHDKARKFKNGQGSYQTLVEHLHNTRLFKFHKGVNARGTITKEALNCSLAVFHLYKMGFRYIYLEPALGKDTSWAINLEDLEIIKEEFNKIADFYKEELLKGNYLILRNFFQPLEKIHKRNRFGYRCTAARKTIAIDPNGDVYPCYKFVGNRNYLMGNVNSKSYDESIRGRFRENHSDRKPGCKNCWARYICGGGCPYLSEISNNNISIKNELDCQFTRHIIKLSLEIYISISLKNGNIWKSLFG